MSEYSYTDYEGLPMRDYFAGQALAGLCANMDTVKKGTSWIVRHAYIAADAMIEERNHKRKNTDE